MAGPLSLPRELDARRLGRRAGVIVGVLVAVGLVAWLAPGFGQVRDRLSRADATLIALAVALEALSSLSYLLMFRPVFCQRMTWRTSSELALSELGVGSLVPASGAGGLALGVWALRRGGMPGDQIAKRTIAFFMLKSASNFVTVAVIGTALGLGLFGPSLSPALTLLPAALAAASIAATALVPTMCRRRGWGTPRPEAGRLRRAVARGMGALDDGVREAGRILARREAAVVLGSVGYWAFDNAVLWACFRAMGSTPAIAVILMGYLIGQLGGLLPLPGGLGGIDGGLVGALVVYGAPLSATAAAVLIYRAILFWVPLVMGAPAFVSLQRGLNRPDRPDLCAPLATEVVVIASREP